MRRPVVRWTAIAGIVVSAIVGLVVAALLNTYLSDYLVRGFVSCVIGIVVAVSLSRNVVARHISSSRAQTGHDPD